LTTAIFGCGFFFKGSVVAAVVMLDDFGAMAANLAAAEAVTPRRGGKARVDANKRAVVISFILIDGQDNLQLVPGIVIEKPKDRAVLTTYNVASTVISLALHIIMIDFRLSPNETIANVVC
jgi:hypothetical protein